MAARAALEAGGLLLVLMPTKRADADDDSDQLIQK
jgi:hypothetical protein